MNQAMTDDCLIRPARADDASDIADIYRPIVMETAISFETEPPCPQEMANRIETCSRTHPYLVAIRNNIIAGYAYGSFYRPRPAYAKSAEVTVYVSQAEQGKGIARLLYGQLLSRLGDQGFHTALAAIALPNEPSIRLHETVGFKKAGIFREVGYKFGQWHDVGWWQKPLTTEKTQ